MGIRAVMEPGLIFISNRHPDFDGGTQYREDSNRGTNLMPSNPAIVTIPWQRHRSRSPFSRQLCASDHVANIRAKAETGSP